MVGNTILRCRIIKKLGGGGIGVAFKAEDTRLHGAFTLISAPRSHL